MRESHPYFVFLTGFMASGKSTVGRKLAEKHGWPFIDLDAYIESVTGAAIHEIFERDGEAAFRKWESDCLQDLLSLPGSFYLVACGGGTPCFFDNTSWMKENGIIVLLDPPFEEIEKRLAEHQGQRPLLTSNQQHGLSHLRSLWEERRPCYLQADHRLTAPQHMLQALENIVDLAISEIS